MKFRGNSYVRHPDIKLISASFTTKFSERMLQATYLKDDNIISKRILQYRYFADGNITNANILKLIHYKNDSQKTYCGKL